MAHFVSCAILEVGIVPEEPAPQGGVAESKTKAEC